MTVAKAKPPGAARISVWQADCQAAGEDLCAARETLLRYVHEFPHTQRALDKIDSALIRLAEAGAINTKDHRANGPAEDNP